MMASEAKTLQPIAQVASVTGDGPLENLLGGGGGEGEVQKKYSRKGKFNEKKFTHAN